MIYQKSLINIILLRESLVSNHLNRIFIGILLLIVVAGSYLFKLESYFIYFLVILISYELYYIKIFNKYIITFLAFFTILSIIFISYELFQNLFLIQSLFVLIIIFFTKYKNLIFTISLYVFCLILFYISMVDRNLFYFLIFISFFNDSVAYLFGRLIGGPKIIPKISPKKTWSGTLISFFLTAILIYYFNYNIIISLILSLSLFLSDILFSFIKRCLNIKDFSFLLKSHGGVLDRLDSMYLFAIIFQIHLVL